MLPTALGDGLGFLQGLAAVDPSLLAAPSFPRGPGMYFSPVKILVLLGLYAMWVKTCWWLDQDAEDHHMDRQLWNGVLLGSGLLGLLLVWSLPIFGLSVVLMLVLYAVPPFVYAQKRNKKVEDDDKILTVGHLKRLAEHYLKMKSAKKKAEEAKPIPIRFVGKSGNARDNDPTRIKRAQESSGYQAALEMVYEAIQNRTTDIHMEPTKEEMTLRFRVDGILQSAAPFSRQQGDAVLNIFKVLADLDITEKRKPQDGSFSAVIDGVRTCDFRVATAGSVAGEKMVMRILDRDSSVRDLKSVGMRPAMNDAVRNLVTQPHGLFVVCGPTGSGKSTTLYTCLNEIDRYQKNVITVENPVEYHIENVTQIEVNPKAGKTFASELRSILRQDPDVIYIGEIRDQETAEIACQAAQTGHMVFTTLHANDTVTSIARLLDLGVQPFLVASALSAVLGQRLVRVLCPKCKVKYKPNAELLRKANLNSDQIKFFCRPPKESEGQGDGEDEGVRKSACQHCGGTGYRGRTGVFELLIITDKIREMVRDSPNLTAIRQEAIKSGMKTLQEDGLRLVIGGQTSVQELLRVSK